MDNFILYICARWRMLQQDIEERDHRNSLTQILIAILALHNVCYSRIYFLSRILFLVGVLKCNVLCLSTGEINDEGFMALRDRTEVHLKQLSF